MAIVAWSTPAKFAAYGIMVPAFVPWVWLAASIMLLLVAAGMATFVPLRYELPAAFQITVALLFLFGFIRFSTIEPMMDPVKTTRPLAARIDGLKMKEIAASDKGSKTEYHVYGHYGVTEVNRRDLAQKKIMPSYFLIAAEELPRYTAFIEAMDYEPFENINVSKDRLMLYQRRSPLGAAVEQTSPAAEEAKFPEEALGQ